jgi:hypothetical protein
MPGSVQLPIIVRLMCAACSVAGVKAHGRVISQSAPRLAPSDHARRGDNSGSAGEPAPAPVFPSASRAVAISVGDSFAGERAKPLRCCYACLLLKCGEPLAQSSIDAGVLLLERINLALLRGHRGGLFLQFVEQ